MARKRDYKKEYARRIARAEARGLSRSQARGHPKASETYIKSRPVAPITDEKVSAALRSLYSGVSLTAAAKQARVSPERLKRALVEKKLGLKQGNRWVVTDHRPRDVPMIINGRTKKITVPGFPEASRVGLYHSRVQKFLRTQDLSFLEEFDGETVIDIKGKVWPFETDPNVLIRFALKDEPPFHEIYAIINP